VEEYFGLPSFTWIIHLASNFVAEHIHSFHDPFSILLSMYLVCLVVSYKLKLITNGKARSGSKFVSVLSSDAEERFILLANKLVCMIQAYAKCSGAGSRSSIFSAQLPMTYINFGLSKSKFEK
jgi:hypothetical protein